MNETNNKITLFYNEKTNATQPDLTGNIQIGDEIMKVALWNNISKTGKKYISGYYSKIEEHKEIKHREPDKVSDNNDLPF